MKIFWILLLLLQIIMWSFLFLLGNLNISDYNIYLYIFFMSCSSSVCFWLNLLCYRKKILATTFKTFKVLSLVWVMNILLFSLTLFVGFIIDALLFLWYIFTIIYIGKQYVFRKEVNYQ